MAPKVATILKTKKMSLIVLCLLFVADAICAPVEETTGLPIEENTLRTDEGRSVQEDTTQTNPVQEWFENLSKNASTGAQNAMNTIKDWISKASQNINNNNNLVSQNLPTMYMGSFQLLKMPMPQFGDVIKGMGDLAAAAQTFNKVTGGLPVPQGIPLLSQGGQG